MRGRRVGEGGIRKGRSWTGDYSTGVGMDFGSSEYCRESEILGVGLIQCTGVAGGFGHGGPGYPLISWG
jgi:hypothetical protein